MADTVPLRTWRHRSKDRDTFAALQTEDVRSVKDIDSLDVAARVISKSSIKNMAEAFTCDGNLIATPEASRLHKIGIAARDLRLRSRRCQNICAARQDVYQCGFYTFCDPHDWNNREKGSHA